MNNDYRVELDVPYLGHRAGTFPMGCDVLVFSDNGGYTLTIIERGGKGCKELHLEELPYVGQLVTDEQYLVYKKFPPEMMEAWQEYCKTDE